MKTNTLFRTVCLTIILTFAFIGVAFAGAVIRRDSSSDERKNTPSVSSRTEHPSESRSSNSKPDKSSERDRTTRESDKSPKTTMKDRTIDATPSYKQSDSKSRDNDRYNDRNNSMKDNSKYDRVGERYSEKSDDRSSRKSYRSPSYRSGRYYYNHGWPYSRGYSLTYGYWAFEYDHGYSLPSAYYYYGYFPYVSYGRVVIVKRPVVTYVEIPIIISERKSGSGYYLDKGSPYSIDAVLYDIQKAWISSEPSLLLRYVKSNINIDVLLDGKYSHSLSAEDYRDMTYDAVDATRTVDFDFEAIRSRGDDRMVAYGKHRFYTLDGSLKTVYISYEFERRGSDWIISEVGSSPKRYGY